MAKLTKTTAFKKFAPKSETSMDKTTRIARKIIDQEAEQRQVNNTRLRNARLEREANIPTKAVGGERKTRPSKTATMR